MTSKTISIGKYRSIQRCSTPDGLFGILAIDHQDSLKRALRPDAPETCTPDDMTAFKLQVVGQLIAQSTGVLLDPFHSAAQAITAGTLGHKGLLVELEKADYALEPLPLDVDITPNWSVDQIKKMGADGVKLFFYYNPFETEHAARQNAVIQQVGEACAHYDIPLYAEPIVYGVGDGHSKRKLVIESAKQTAQFGVDVLKLEFPLDVTQYPDPATWGEACEELTDALDIPWVLLSAGVSFETFARQVEVACKAGAAGFIVGRAIWGDAARIEDAAQRDAWLTSVGAQRMQLLQAITALHGRAWHQQYAPPPITSNWFEAYQEMSS
ncbi:MAG: tagatose 1,6-diphosphate aldolase [Chloroflexota bacterium]